MNTALRNPLSGLLCLPCLFLLLTLAGCTGPQVLNGLTSSSGFDRASNVQYDPELGLRLDVYTPKTETKKPVVVFFYGGRWSSGRKEDYEFVGGALTGSGYCTVIPNVRQYPIVRFPAFVEDGAHVIKWVHNNIDQYNCDPKRIFVMGHSSGAHIAAMLALDEEFLQGVGGSRTWLRGMVGMAGPYDFLPLTDPTLRDLFGPPESFEKSQPILYTDGHNPPLLLMSGEDDEVVEVKNTRNLAASVGRAGGPVETVIYPKMPDERLLASIGPVYRGQSDVLAQIKSFLDKWSNNNYASQLNTPDIQTTPLPP